MREWPFSCQGWSHRVCPVQADLRCCRPQLDGNSIRHLCATCKISTVFADERNYDTAQKLKDGVLAINISNVLFNIKADPAATFPVDSRASDIAYFFHTSGTSSGLPKPIPQTHYAAVGVLPRLPGGDTHATFSTTPLYHGGIADCFRAWTSGATIHLFPGTQPITTDNIRRAVDRANASFRGSCPVRYFTAVPYILQMLAAESSSSEVASGISILQVMDRVGVGGAALPASVGDELVVNNVKVVSRYGSAECGFLLSSHRDYANDRDWAYLRANPALQPAYYDFELQTRDHDEHNAPVLFEFVVKPKWPHRGKTNRPDGSFATADLFEAHPTIPHAWRYHSRADAQITLINGKKFDPAAIESDLLASAMGKQTLRDAMIFGTGREAPGLLLLPRWSTGFVEDEQVIDKVWSVLEKMNGDAQTHARIGRGMIVVVRGQGDEPVVLPKSSKGTILRRQAEEMFAAEIEEAYGEMGGSAWEKADIPDSQVMDELTRLFAGVLGREVNPTDDLFAQGVDSVVCAQVRKRISKHFAIATDKPLPLNIIYDQGSIERLASYILRCRVAGDVMVPGSAGNEGAHSAEQLMLDLVEKYRHAIHSPTASFDHQKERVVVLTGATGFLGAHVLDLLLRDAAVSRVFCLVRAKDAAEAKERILQSMQLRELEFVEDMSKDEDRLVCLASTLSELHLGLTEADWKRIAAQATMFIHSAWAVNFSLNLQSFDSQLSGLRNLLELRDATHGAAARFVFISSTAAVTALGTGDGPIPETLSTEPEDASPLGYSRSKWVAENICSSARVMGGSASASPSQVTEERIPVVVVRVGQLCGNARGVWNAAEAWPLLLSAARATGSLPDLKGEALAWLPVDVAAQAVLEIAFGVSAERPGSRMPKTPVFHVANPYQDPRWGDMVSWLVEEAASKQEKNADAHGGLAGLRVVAPDVWLQELEALLERRDHPARALLHVWQRTFSAGEREEVGVVFDTQRAEAASAAMRAMRPLERDGVLRMWEWIGRHV